MQRLINLILNNKHFLLFSALFTFSLFLTIQSHGFHKNKWTHNANFVSGSLYTWRTNITNYFNLKRENKLLAAENTRLKNLINNIKEQDSPYIQNDSLYSNYKFTAAKIIQNNYAQTKNRLTINKGQQDSIQADMGVVTPNGLVGIILKTSSRFAVVQSVLNTDTRINAALKKSNHFGILSWNAKNPYEMQLEDIPRLAQVAQGDTVVTAGYSSIFPAGIPIGKISHIQLEPGADYYQLSIRLFEDLTTLSHVYVIRNVHKAEIITLQNTDNGE